MGRLDRIKQAQEASNANIFNPIDLNEGNVEAIFNKCLSTKDSPSVLSCDLFPPFLGNSQPEYSSFDFDKKTILANKATIQYLFGQLNSVHTQKDVLTIEDFFENYLHNNWSTRKALLLELLYLGNCDEIALIHPFNARKGITTRFMSVIKPTLSPKDPNFPAWWEQHKAEWEDNDTKK